MTTKSKTNAALEAPAKVTVEEPSRTSLSSLTPLPFSQPAKTKGKASSKGLLSKPIAINLYPEDLDKIEQVISYLRSKGCERVSRSRVAQLALRQLAVGDTAVAVFKKLPDYREKDS